MELPKVVIRDFNEFLNGKEVEASPVRSKQPIQPGERVIAFKDSVAATAEVTVPTNEFHRSIGVEGTVTGVEATSLKHQNVPTLKVKKV